MAGIIDNVKGVPTFGGQSGQPQPSPPLNNDADADALYGKGGWYKDGFAGTYMQKNPMPADYAQQVAREHWSYYGRTPIEGMQRQASGAAPYSDAERDAIHFAPGRAAQAAQSQAPSAPPTAAVFGGSGPAQPPQAPTPPSAPSAPVPLTAPTAPTAPQASGQPAPGRPASDYGSLTTSASRVQVNPGETAEGIISRLIGNTNTPLMQRAMAIAEQKAAERGLQSSSIAAGAGAQAAIDAAMPIAQIDAGNYAANARQDASAQNQINAQGNDFYYDVKRGFIQQDLTKELEQMRSQLDLNTRQLLLKATSEIEGSNTGKQALINTTGKYTNLVNQIRVDPDLSAEEKAGAIADLQSDWTEESRRIAMIYKIDIPPEYLPTPG